jgi:hypothetical protein
VCPLVAEPRLAVAEDPLIEALELAAKFAHGPRSQVTQVTQGKPGVLACDLDLTAEGKVVAAEHFRACHKPL